MHMAIASDATPARPSASVVVPLSVFVLAREWYKNFDPRAKIIRAMCYRVLDKLGIGDDPVFELALTLEEIALKDDYFVSRKLYPNVDFYSGIIYSALGIPRSMFTVLFAIARTAGWVAHWQEMVSDPHMRIGRPRQLYTGPTKRDYQAIEKRVA